MQRRTVPVGVSPWVHRGSSNLLRITPTHCLMSALGGTSLVVPNPDDANERCLPYFLVQSLVLAVTKLVPSARRAKLGDFIIND